MRIFHVIKEIFRFQLFPLLLFLFACGGDESSKIDENPPWTPQGINLEKISNSLSVESPGTFNVKLNTNPGKNITITPTLTKVSDNSEISPSSIVLDENTWNSGKKFTISGICDDSPSNAVFSILLSTSNNYADNITNFDATYKDGNNLNLEVNTASGVISGEIAESADVQTSYTQGYTTESGGSFKLYVQLCTAPSSTVTVTAAITKNPDEVTVTPTSYAFDSSNWNIEQPFTITGADDSVTDGNEKFTVLIDASGYLDSGKTFEFLNYDNETASIIVENKTISTSETGTSDNFTVVLSQQPSADVNVPIRLTDVDGITVSDEATANTSNLVFTSGNWNTAQTVTITGSDDSDNDSDMNYYIYVGGVDPSNPTGYQNLPAQTLNGINVDNE